MANNEVRRLLKRQWILADHATDFSPTAGNDLEQGSQVDVDWDSTSLADSAYRQADKMDFSVDGASDELVDLCSVVAAFELAATPTAGEVIYLYMAWSPDGTAGNGNPAGASGSDSAYTGYNSNADASIKQADLVATFVVTADATTTVQIIDGGEFVPKERYGCPIVRNESGAAFHSDAVESHISIDGFVYEVQ